MKFPCQVKLTETPDSTAAAVMTVGNIYTAYGWAGSCLIVSSDEDDNKQMVHYERFALPITT